MSTFGSRIKDRRLELGMSVDELAEKLGKNRATVYRYENDEIGNIPVGVVTDLAKVLGVRPEYIMGWVIENPASTGSGMVDKAIQLMETLPEDRKEVAVNLLQALASTEREHK